MAIGYRDMRFSGVSPSTAAGYSAALKVFLGYSAFEAACGAAGRDHNAVTSVRPGLGRALRAVGAGADDGEFPLAHTLKSSTLKSKISTTVRGESADVVPIAAAIRHLVAHGVFTVHGGKADTNRAVSALWALGDDMLQLSESILESYLAEKLAVRQ